MVATYINNPTWSRLWIDQIGCRVTFELEIWAHKSCLAFFFKSLSPTPFSTPSLINKCAQEFSYVFLVITGRLTFRRLLRMPQDAALLAFLEP